MIKTELGRWWHAFFVILQFSYRSVMLRKAGWLGTLIFAGCLLILFPFAFGTETIKRPEIRFGAYWVINEFVVALTVSRLFTSEQEGGALEFLLASRSPRSALLCGKIAFTTLQLLSLQVPITLLWIIFYNVQIETLGDTFRTLLPVCFLFNLGTASVGALISCATSRSLAKEILQPILFFPLQIALLVGSVTLCLRTEADSVLSTLDTSAWWAVIGGFPLIFIGLGFFMAQNLFQE